MSVALAELVDIEIRGYRVGVDVEAFGEEVLTLLRVVLCLQGIVEYLRWPYAHAIRGISHLVDFGVGEVHASVPHALRGTAHENKILLVLYCAVEYLPAVFQPLPEKCLLIVARRGDAYEQFVCVGFHGLLEQVVLLRLLEGVDLIADGDVAVERVLRIRVGCQRADEQRAVAEVGLDAVLVVIVDDVEMPAVLVVLAHAPDVVLQKVEALQRLHQRGGSDIGFRAAPAIPEGKRPGKRGRKAGVVSGRESVSSQIQM